ncbi:hypothetical protein DDR33_24660, partial [Pararcticibacter amylolyticus]
MYPVLMSLLLLISHSVLGQNGVDMYDAIDAGTFSACGVNQFSDTHNNSYYGGVYYYDNYNASVNGNQYEGQSSPDVWYMLNISGYTDLTVSLCGSSLDTYLHLLDAGGNEIMSNDDYCGFSSQLNYSGLSDGTYYVVVEGYSSSTGDYTLNISSPSTGSAPTGANMYNPIVAGTYSSSGYYTHTMSNADPCLGNDMGQPSNDIYYQFTLTGTATVTLSHCGSTLDTYLYLLNSSGGLINQNDDNSELECPGSQSWLQTTLSAGTYYVVSEGYGSGTGNITTNIRVSMGPSTPVIAYTFPSEVTSGSPVSVNVTNTGAATVSGQTTSTYAGTGTAGYTNSSALSSTFNNPLAVVADASGNIYVADAGNNVVRKITPGGTVSTLAGAGYSGYAEGTGSGAQFKLPSALVIDASGNLIVTDQQNHRIRKISPSGSTSLFAGSGTAGFA